MSERPDLNEVELKVLTCAARGDTSLATAKRLSYSVHTIKEYRARILARFGASNITQAVAIAHDRGILGPNSGEPRAASDGQIGMLHARLGELDRKLSLDRGTSKEALLTTASREFDRVIGSVYELRYREASWCIDTVTDQLADRTVGNQPNSVLEIYGSSG